MAEIKAAIVGCGRISDLHVLGYRECDNASIAAVFDMNILRAQKKAKEWAVSNVYKSYEALLDDPDVNLVELLVPHHLHAEMTIAACQAGKHVSVQKPMAMNVREADQMIESADKAGVLLRVYENFVFYPPYIRAKELIDSGEIGEPQMIRVHVGTGKSKTAWKVPLSAWRWRFNDEKNSGGVMVFDHGYHLFSLIYYLMGEVECVYAWIDRSPVGGGIPQWIAQVDSPAIVMFQFKSPRKYGVLDFVHTPNLVMDTNYYADDDRVEVIGDKGIILINRCTARTINLPELMLYKGGITSAIKVDRVEWHDSFIDCTKHMVETIRYGGMPVLDGQTGKAVLQFALAAQISAKFGSEVRPYEL